MSRLAVTLAPVISPEMVDVPAPNVTDWTKYGSWWFDIVPPLTFGATVLAPSPYAAPYPKKLPVGPVNVSLLKVGATSASPVPLVEVGKLDSPTFQAA